MSLRFKFGTAIFLFFISAFTFNIFAESGIIAIVNNEVITQKDLNDFINFMRMQMSTEHSQQEIEQRIKQMLPDLRNRLIEDRLILQAAYKENVVAGDIRIKARLEQIKRDYRTESDFREALIAQGLSQADLELRIKEQLLMMEMIERKIKSKIVVKPWEVTEYYNTHRKEIKNPEQRSARLLVIKDPGLVKRIQRTITRYSDLDTLAERHSLDINELGWVAYRQLKKEIADVIFNSQVGQITSFLDPDGSFYVFEVEEIMPPVPIPLLEAQEEINRLLFEKKMQEALVEWLDELKSEAYIEIK